jgi:hypothetical protein
MTFFAHLSKTRIKKQGTEYTNLSFPSVPIPSMLEAFTYTGKPGTNIFHFILGNFMLSMSMQPSSKPLDQCQAKRKNMV